MAAAYSCIEAPGKELSLVFAILAKAQIKELAQMMDSDLNEVY